MNELSEKFVVTTDTDVLIHISQESPIMTKTRLPSFYHLDKWVGLRFCSLDAEEHGGRGRCIAGHISEYLRIRFRVQKHGKTSAWILRITRNLCLMKLRDRKKIAATPFRRIEPVV